MADIYYNGDLICKSKGEKSGQGISAVVDCLNSYNNRDEIIPDIPSFGLPTSHHPHHNPNHVTPNHVTPNKPHHHTNNKINIPSPLPNYTLPVKFFNQIELGNREVFVVVKGLNLKQNACFLDISTTPFSCPAISSGTNSIDFTFSLDMLPQNNDGSLEMYLPMMISARMYFSISKPITLAIGFDSSTNKPTIEDPDGFNTNDPNYYILYDKIEFNFQRSGGLYIDATAVDFFGLPITIEDPGSLKFTKSGAEGDRTTILSTMKSKLCNDNNLEATWCNLILNYNGYMDGNKAEKLEQILRVSSPGKSMLPNGKNANFDPNYLDNSSYGFSYYDFLADYYSPGNSRIITLNCSELANANTGLSNFIFSGNIQNIGGQNTFVLNNGDTSYPINIAFPASVSFFAGGGAGSFNFINDTPGAVIVKLITSAFDVGLLPPIFENDVLSSEYFKQNKDKYYTNNSHFPLVANNSGPWYDLYAATIHQNVASKLYAFAYDDELDNDGTLNDPKSQRPSTLTVTLQPLGASKNIPNPFYDPNTYNLNILLGATPNCAMPLTIRGKQYSSSSTFSLNSQHIPFDFEFVGKKYALYVDPKIITPSDNLSDSIVVLLSGEDASISFPGSSISC